MLTFFSLFYVTGSVTGSYTEDEPKSVYFPISRWVLSDYAQKIDYYAMKQGYFAQNYARLEDYAGLK